MPFIKQASDADVAVADRLLRQIHDENPSFWPYGLSRAHFDGGLYLLSKQAGMEPVGFVGWQERQEQGRRVGYYSIGILPEHRRKEYAKRAVQAVLTEKSAGVDEVRAMVARHNAPSKYLAKSLEGVTLLEKDAAARTIIGALLGSAIGGPGLDYAKHGEGQNPWTAFKEGIKDPARRHQMGMNTVLGGGSGIIGAHGSPKTAITLGLAIPGKDLLIQADSKLHDLDINKLNTAAERAAAPRSAGIPKSVLYGGLGIGAAGLGAAVLTSVLRLKAEREKAEVARSGRIRVTLPTKNPGDSETTIDLPTEGFDMSQALQGKLKRDTRQRLLLETRQRTKHRKPRDPNNPTDAEKEIMALDEEQAALDAEMGKAARTRLSSYFKQAGAAAPAVPSPPAQGTNPALRMTQEAQSAQQLAAGAATDANPQIAQAQQAAQAAEQKAQQDVAAAQQAQQAEAMQRDQAHAQELVKKDQEVFQARQEIEIQKTEVEKAKVEMELAKAKIEAAQELEEEKKSMTESISKGDNSAVHRMNKHRLARIKSSLNKVAAATPPAPYSFTPPAPAATKELLPSVAQRINDRGFEYQAHGGLSRPHLFRTSYGKLGDTAYGMLARPFLMTPGRDDAADWASLSPETMAANPDAFDSMLRAGQTVLNAPR